MSKIVNSTATSWLTVDARMLFSSGIGRYLREVVSRWPAESAQHETYICNQNEQVEWLADVRPGAKVVMSKASIYSAREQFIGLGFPANSVYWVPHYNLPLFCQARLVATVHDAAPLVLREVFNRRFQQLAARFYFGIARRSTHRVIAVSQFTADELSRHAGVNSKKIKVITNGVSDDWFSAAPRVSRPVSRLLFVGNLKAHKNLRRLIEGIDLLRKEGNQEINLEVVGQVDGFRTGLETGTVEILRSRPWILLHGTVSDAKLRELYANVSALVFPSLYEGFGLPMLEAMASGCPVLASNVASLPEIGGPDQKKGGCVAYFDPRDIQSIAACIDAFIHLPPEERLRMAESGCSRAREYSWEQTAQRTYDSLRDVRSNADPTGTNNLA